jgi:transposase
MENVRFVGLDVHKDTIAIAVAESVGGPARVQATVAHDFPSLMKQLRRIGSAASLSVCYEAGPTGFGLCRFLRKSGINCVVIAPSLVPKKAGDRIKTDRRDAAKLAHFLRSGDLTPVHVPDESTEAMRDLERARDDAKNAERACRQQLGKFLLRHGRRYDGKTHWTTRHLDWVRTLRFDHEAQTRVLTDHLHAVESATERVLRLTQDITKLVESWSLKPLVTALQALRGVRLITAVVVAAEIADFGRFDSAPAFMAYLGLVPSEHSSGDGRRQGRITRTGNKSVRRLLTESAWSSRFRPARNRELKARQVGVAPEILAISWKAQHRLHHRYTRLLARGKAKQKVIIAVARELAGFIWCVGRQSKLLVA